MKSSVGKGAVILIVAGFVCKFFGALFRLPLTNIIGIKGIGVFQMIMSLYSLMLVLVTGGVTNSLSKLISQARARGEKTKISGFLAISILFALSLSFVISIIFAFFAKSISSWQGIGKAYSSYLLFLILIPVGALIGVFRGVIQGYENMVPTAVSQVLEQIIKFGFGLFFAYLFSRYGAEKGVFGAFLGITFSEFIAFLYLAIVMIKKMKISPKYKNNISCEFFNAVLPLTFAGAIVPLTHAIDASIIVTLLSMAGFASEKATALFGLQTGMVGAIFNFPLIISLSVGMALLPKISFLSGNGKINQEKQVINKAFSLMWFFLIPLVFGLMAISKLLFPIIYSNSIKGFLNIAVELSYLSGISVILTAIMQFLLSLLQAKGYFTFSFVITLVAGIVKVIFVVVFARMTEINIFAIALSNIALSLVVVIGALIKMGRLVSINYFNLFVPLLSSMVMFISLKIFLSSVILSPILLLLLSVVIGATIYFVLDFPIVKSFWDEFVRKK